MNILLDKAALLFLFIINILSFNSEVMPVIILLIVVSLSALNQALSGKNSAVAIGIVQAVSCFIHPAFCCSIPLVIYDIFSAKKPFAAILLPIAVIINYSSLNHTQLLIILCGTFIAFLLYRNINKLKTAESNLIKTRDNSEEINLILQEKNHRLLENQDYEINLATMKERNRIAREIHDNVGHMLTRSILQVGALSIINKDETVGENLNILKETLNSAMTSIRNSVHNLHDDSINLKLTVEEAVKPLKQKFTVTYSYDFSETMPSKIKLCFIGIVKECASNVIKHSNGDKIIITINEHPGFYHLSFGDNGKCDGKINESGIGLSNIKERADSVNGFVNISSEDNGFKVFVSVPKK